MAKRRKRTATVRSILLNLDYNNPDERRILERLEPLRHKRGQKTLIVQALLQYMDGAPGINSPELLTGLAEIKSLLTTIKANGGVTQSAGLNPMNTAFTPAMPTFEDDDQDTVRVNVDTQLNSAVGFLDSIMKLGENDHASNEE